VSLVIPVFDEVDNVAPLLAEIAAALDGAEAFEAVVVDDGSSDGTDRALAQALAAYPWLRARRHPERCGKAAALRTGIQAAAAPLVATLDGDRQNDPADLPELLRAFRAAQARDASVALLAGQRATRREGWTRRAASRIANTVRAAVLGDATRDSACGVKVIRREVFLALPHFDGLHRFLPALVRAQGHAVITADVRDRPRAAGRPKYGIWRRLWVGLLDMAGVVWLIQRSRRPARVIDLSQEDAP
jgi:glycosyltransferase involved in cell wall biosynthesis